MFWGGFGRGFGRGFGFGGGGRGNPYPFCRWYPWLPRRWWAYPSSWNMPWSRYPGVPTMYGYPGVPPMYGYPGSIAPSMNPPAQEKQMLEEQLKFLEEQLKIIQKRLAEL